MADFNLATYKKNKKLFVKATGAKKKIKFTSERHGADFTFLALSLSEVPAYFLDDGTLDESKITELLDSVMVTVIDQEMLDDFGVMTRKDALSFIFTVEEAELIALSLVNDLNQSTTISIKKK